MTNDEQRQLITPVCFGIASAIFVAILIYDAADIEAGNVATHHYTSSRNAAVGAMIRALAEMLGLVGSIVAGALLIAVMIGWTALGYRKIKRARPA